MSENFDAALEMLSKKVKPGDMDFSVALHVIDEGVIRLDENGACQSTEDLDADLTLIAKMEVFEGVMDGTMNPAAAAMSGKVKVRGDYSYAMRLGSILF